MQVFIALLWHDNAENPLYTIILFIVVTEHLHRLQKEKLDLLHCCKYAYTFNTKLLFSL
jgi:hypothetical protein